MLKFNIKKVTFFLNTFLLLLFVVFLPKIVDMESYYSNYINLFKIFTFIFNFCSLFLIFNYKKINHINKYYKELSLQLIVIILSVLIFNPTLINFATYGCLCFSYRSHFSLKIYIFTKIFLLSIVIILFIILDLNIIHTIYEGDVVRYTLGFTNPNTASMMLFDIAVGMFILYRRNIIVLSCLFLIIFFVYKMTISRTLIISTGLLIILYFTPSNIFKIFKKPIALFPIAMIFLTVSLIFFRDTQLNIFLSNRPQMIYDCLNKGTLTLFGNSKFNTIAFVDNSYLRMIFEYGIIFFILYISLYYMAVKKMYSYNKYMYIKIFIVISIYDVFEKFSFDQGTIILVCIPTILAFKHKTKEVSINE